MKPAVFIDAISSTNPAAKNLADRLQKLGFAASYMDEKEKAVTLDKANVVICILCGCCGDGMDLVKKYAFQNDYLSEEGFKPVVIVRTVGYNNYYLRGALRMDCSDGALIEAIGDAMSMTAKS